MSKLSEKIEAAHGQVAHLFPDTSAYSQVVFALQAQLTDILADVRELERQVASHIAHAPQRMRDREEAIRQAKHEAYEHALRITQSQWPYPEGHEQDVSRRLQQAIDALESEDE